MGKENADERPRRKIFPTIPRLQDLLYRGCGFEVPNDFTLDFVNLHEGNWALAERDWVKTVALALNTKEVGQASGAQAIKKAVEDVAVLLADDELWPWCPICWRGSDAEEGRSNGV